MQICFVLIFFCLILIHDIKYFTGLDRILPKKLTLPKYFYNKTKLRVVG